ncbi:hypothetical protein GOODEAATRI_016752, partial [Goodea atripinnis]
AHINFLKRAPPARRSRTKGATIRTNSLSHRHMNKLLELLVATCGVPRTPLNTATTSLHTYNPDAPRDDLYTFRGTLSKIIASGTICLSRMSNTNEDPAPFKTRCLTRVLSWHIWLQRGGAEGATPAADDKMER